MGRLTADPELKQTQSGTAVTSFSLAVDRKYNKDEEKKCDFITIVAWKQTAEFICKYFKKGSAICVTGSIQTRSWTDQQGQKRYATEVLVDEANFVDSNGQGGTGFVNADSYDSAPQFASTPAAEAQFEDMSGDDDLPF
jgi:single-strand DNA-binding protein